MTLQCTQGTLHVGDNLRPIFANWGFVFNPACPDSSPSPSQLFSISPYSPPAFIAILLNRVAFSFFTCVEL
jgi:hypothetical protein